MFTGPGVSDIPSVTGCEWSSLRGFVPNKKNSWNSSFKKIVKLFGCLTGVCVRFSQNSLNQSRFFRDGAVSLVLTFGEGLK